MKYEITKLTMWDGDRRITIPYGKGFKVGDLEAFRKKVKTESGRTPYFDYNEIDETITTNES